MPDWEFISTLASSVNNVTLDVERAEKDLERKRQALRDAKRDLAAHPQAPTRAGDRLAVVMSAQGSNKDEWVLLIKPGGEIERVRRIRDERIPIPSVPAPSPPLPDVEPPLQAGDRVMCLRRRLVGTIKHFVPPSEIDDDIEAVIELEGIDNETASIPTSELERFSSKG